MKSVILLALFSFCEAYKILVLMPYDGQSHFNAFSALFENLAQKGHNLTIISYSRTKFHSNNIESVWLGRKERIHVISLEETGSVITFLSAPFRMKIMSQNACEYGLQSRAFRNFLHKSNNFTFDVILTEFFITDCFHGAITKFKAPVIGKFKNKVI